MHKGTLLVIFLTALGFYASAQNLDNEKPTYISIKDGLPDATITAICQDDDGFLWIGTGDGLSRYDGAEFKNYYHSKTGNSIPGNYINALQILPGHRLLIATASGLGLFNTRSSVFKNLVISSGRRTFGFENNFKAIAADKDNHIWAGSQTALYELDTAMHILQSKHGYEEKEIDTSVFLYVQDIKRLPDGQVMFKLQHGVKGMQYRWYIPVDKKIAPLQYSPVVYKKILEPDFLGDVAFDKKGNAWFIKTPVDSLFYFDHRLNTVTVTQLGNIKGLNQISYNSRISLINDHFGGCSLLNGGMLYSNAALPGNKGVKPQWGIALPGKHVVCTFYDRENNLWIGTTNGLYKFTLAANSLALSALPQNDAVTGSNIELSGIFTSPGKIFLATTGGGIFYTNNNNIDWQNLRLKSTGDLVDTWNVRAIANGGYWIGTQQGLFEWRQGERLPKPLPLPSGWQWINSLPVTTQFTDKENILWMGLGVGNGVAAFNLNNSTIKLYSRKNRGSFPLRYPLTLGEDEYGDLWMGGIEGTGLVYWNRKTDRFAVFPPEFNTDFDNGIVNAVYTDRKGSVWLGTGDGLVKFDIVTKKFKKYDTRQGLSSNTIYSLAADNAKHLWIGTKNGLSCMDMGSGKLFNFNGYYLYSEDQVNCVKYDRDRNKIYFITPHNFYSITPNEWLTPRVRPQLFVTGATSSGRNLDIRQNISLDYGDNNINIAFTAVNLVDGGQNKYFYSLNNQDGKWIAAGSSRQVSFSSLLPGKYNFRVKAQLPDGTWSKNQGTVLFSVAAPFWKTWWFIISNIVLLSALIYSAYRYRISQIMKLQAIRSRIASDLHDDIGSTLSNINILTQLSHASLAEPETANRFLTRIAEEVNSSSQSLDDIVWSINTNNDTFDETAARMRRYAAELFERTNIEYKVYFDDKLSAKKLNLEQRRDIYLIFREALNNIYKHAQATLINISLESDHRNFKMIITDNGLGFDPLQPTARNGLKNMKARVKKSKGVFTIDSGKGKGTILIISMQIFR